MATILSSNINQILVPRFLPLSVSSPPTVEPPPAPVAVPPSVPPPPAAALTAPSARPVYAVRRGDAGPSHPPPLVVAVAVPRSSSGARTLVSGAVTPGDKR